MEKKKEEYRTTLLEIMGDLPIFGTKLVSTFFESIIEYTVVICLSPNFRNIFSPNYFRGVFHPSIMYNTLETNQAVLILSKILSLKKASLGTVWMIREVDKIIGMVYFLIVVAFLIFTLSSDQLFNTHFLDKFLDIFQGSEQSSEQAKAQARMIILVLSSVFFGAVLYKLIKRLKELQSKALTTFVFLLEREAIKIEPTNKEKDYFDKSLQEIEQYLTNGDWTLAELLVSRIMKEYGDFIRKEWIEKKEINAEDGKDKEKKVSTEEIKNSSNIKVNYQDLGIY